MKNPSVPESEWAAASVELARSEARPMPLRQSAHLEVVRRIVAIAGLMEVTGKELSLIPDLPDHVTSAITGGTASLLVGTRSADRAFALSEVHRALTMANLREEQQPVTSMRRTFSLEMCRRR